MPEYLHREKTDWYRGKSVVLGYVFSAMKLIKEKRLLNKLFPKWVVVEESNFELQSKNVQVAFRERKIVEHFLKSDQIVFVGSSKLDEKILEIFNYNLQKIITIPHIEDKKYHYWKVTGLYGHWNVEGHKEIAKSLQHKINKLKL